MVEYFGLPKLSDEQLNALCSAVDGVARNYVFSHISKKDVIELSVQIEADQNDILNLTIDIDLEVDPFLELNVDKLAEEALDFAFKAAEEKLQKIASVVK
ncbi:MAG: DUF3194 domain-containing protein [Euryarchaeota archaeon]|nr:DUF3194 domain-containing protein [Euryarchaeota archaeon]